MRLLFVGIGVPLSRHHIGALPGRLYKPAWVASLPVTPPPADIHVDLALAKRLLASQHPDLVAQDVRIAAEGWDNVIFRVGEELALRIPRREMAAKLIEHEQQWLPELAAELPIPIPAAVRIGRPTEYFPYAWSVVPWVGGTMALHDALHSSQAARLGSFLKVLHQLVPPPDPPVNPYRGGSLGERRELYARRVEAAAETLGEEHTSATWRFLDDAFRIAIPDAPSWIHGDLHSKNVIARDGRIASVIDWGDICTGDRATDLASLWIMFEPRAHDIFWSSYGDVEDDLMARARAWAVAFGLMLYDSHHESDPTFARAGITTIQRAVPLPSN